MLQGGELSLARHDQYCDKATVALATHVRCGHGGNCYSCHHEYRSASTSGSGKSLVVSQSCKQFAM